MEFVIKELFTHFSGKDQFKQEYLTANLCTDKSFNLKNRALYYSSVKVVGDSNKHSLLPLKFFAPDDGVDNQTQLAHTGPLGFPGGEEGLSYLIVVSELRE